MWERGVEEIEEDFDDMMNEWVMRLMGDYWGDWSLFLSVECCDLWGVGVSLFEQYNKKI